MFDKLFVEKKLEMLSETVKKLEPLVASPVSNIKIDEVKLAAIERFFQQSVDTMIDINVHIIREGGFNSPDDLQSTFITLGQHKVLDEKFSNKIAPIVGARNMLVHRYEKLDKDMFLNNLKNNFSDFKTYIIQIVSFLKES